MIQGSTPLLSILVKGKDLTQAQRIRVTIRQHGSLWHFDDDRVTPTADDAGTILLIHLTQAETLTIQPGRVGVQARWCDAAGEWHTTKSAIITQLEAYCKEVLTV